jgi:hypothetical protein
VKSEQKNFLKTSNERWIQDLSFETSFMAMEFMEQQPCPPIWIQ